jgi:hypothetical protein
VPGLSIPAGLPDFRQLVLDVYKRIDVATYEVLLLIPTDACNRWSQSSRQSTDEQQAEVQRFIQGDYDVVLGMLERRIDGQTARTSKVRSAVTEILRSKPKQAVAIHEALVRLADRGQATTKRRVLRSVPYSRSSVAEP